MTSFSQEARQRTHALRAAITRMISNRAADLNPLVTYRALAPVNALTLAWRLYQSSDRDLEIVRRTGQRVEQTGAAGGVLGTLEMNLCQTFQIS